MENFLLENHDSQQDKFSQHLDQKRKLKKQDEILFSKDLGKYRTKQVS